MNDSDATVPPEQLRVMQIIAGALPLGLICFLAIVLVLGGGQQQQQPVPGLPMVSLVAAAGFVGCVLLSFIFPSAITRTGLRQIVDGTWKEPEGVKSEPVSSTPAKLLSLRQTTMIVGLAPLEGAGFFGCAAYLVEHQVAVLSIAGVAILLMLLRFPTAGRVSAWLEQQAAVLLDMQRAKDLGTR